MRTPPGTSQPFGHQGRNDTLPRCAAAAAGMRVALPDKTAQLGLHPLEVNSQPATVGAPATSVVDHAAARTAHAGKIGSSPIDQLRLILRRHGVALIVAGGGAIADMVVQLRGEPGAQCRFLGQVRQCGVGWLACGHDHAVFVEMLGMGSVSS